MPVKNAKSRSCTTDFAFFWRQTLLLVAHCSVPASNFSCTGKPHHGQKFTSRSSGFLQSSHSAPDRALSSGAIYPPPAPATAQVNSRKMPGSSQVSCMLPPPGKHVCKSQEHIVQVKRFLNVYQLPALDLACDLFG